MSTKCTNDERSTDHELTDYTTDEEREHADTCDCAELGGFPCWPCVQTGRKDVPK